VVAPVAGTARAWPLVHGAPPRRRHTVQPLASVAGPRAVSCLQRRGQRLNADSHLTPTPVRACHTTLRLVCGQNGEITPGARAPVSAATTGCRERQAPRHLPTKAAATAATRPTPGCRRASITPPSPRIPAALPQLRAGIGMRRTHIPTTQQCDVCHGTLAWKPARIDHSGFYQRLRQLPQQRRRRRHVPRAYDHPARLRHLSQLPGLEPHPLPSHQRRVPGCASRRLELHQLPTPPIPTRCPTPRRRTPAPVPAAMRRTSSRSAPQDHQGCHLPPPVSWPTAVVPATSTAIRRSQQLQGVSPDRIIGSRMRRSITEICLEAGLRTGMGFPQGIFIPLQLSLLHAFACICGLDFTFAVP